VRPRSPALARLVALAKAVALAGAAALACVAEPPVDPLDPELIRELSLARGSATGNTHGGGWQFDFDLETCDCPSIELDGQTQDLCDLVQFLSGELQLTHADGILAIPIGPVTSTGAIETDGSFTVASHYDASSLLGPLESLGRIDGQFDPSSTHAEGSVTQRLLGELANDPIDCRWIGTFTAERP
jgi:hypothetical protein